MGQARGSFVANLNTYTSGGAFYDGPFFLNDGRAAYVPFLTPNDSSLTTGIIILDPTTGPGVNNTEEFFGETDIRPLAGLTDVNSVGQVCCYVPATNAIWRLFHNEGALVIGGGVSRPFYFEAAVFDLDTMTMTRSDLGWPPIFGSVGQYTERRWGASGIGVLGSTIYAMRFDPRTDGNGLKNDQDCLVINAAAITASLVNCGLGATHRNSQWGVLVEGANGHLYAAPGTRVSTAPADTIHKGLEINPSGPTFTADAFGTSVTGAPGAITAWSNVGFKDANNRLWAMPSQQTTWALLNMTTEVVTTTTFGLTSGQVAGLWPGMGADGMIYLVPTGNLSRVVRVDPSTLVGTILDFSLNEAPDSITRSSLPVMTPDINAIQLAGTSINSYRITGMRTLVGKGAISPAAATATSGVLEINAKPDCPLRATPYVWYDTKTWDGGYTLENLGSAGADFDLNVAVHTDISVSGSTTTWTLSAGLIGGVSVSGDPGTGPGGARRVADSSWATLDTFDGPLWNEPYTIMVMFDGDTARPSSFDFATFPLDTAIDQTAQMTFSGSYQTVSSGTLRVDVTTSSGGNTLRLNGAATLTADALFAVTTFPRFGGGTTIVKTGGVQTWRHTVNAGGVLSSVSTTGPTDYATISSAVGWVGATMTANVTSTPYPSSVIGQPWGYMRGYAIFRGEPTPADIDAWYATFF